jgi:Clp protease
MVPLLLLLCMRLCQVSQMINKNMKMEEALARITGHSREKVRADLQRDFYLSAAEAVQYGIIDKVCCVCMMHCSLCTSTSCECARPARCKLHM